MEAENLLVGLSPADDAAVYKLDEERALVFTLDFFPPLVDDPATFGRIAATNALNDVFAMGGVPLLALSIAAFPEELPNEVLAAVFSGADEQVRAAGALLAGGHTIRDAEPKYGLAVVGTVHPNGIWPKSGRARRRRGLPDEAARHGSRARRARQANRRRTRARGSGALDDDAERRCGRRAAPVRAARRHGRHGFRTVRPRARDRRAERRAYPHRRARDARARRCARDRATGRAYRRRPAQPRLRGPARRERRRLRRPAGARPTTRRRRAACS